MMKSSRSSTMYLEKRDFIPVLFHKLVAWMLTLVFVFSLLTPADAGAEKTAFDATPWDNSPLLDEIEAIRHQAYYNFGYTLGYCVEQCATAALGTAAAKISQVCLKSGISLVGKLAPRAMAVCAMRLNFLKEALIGLNLADDGLRLAYEGAMTSAARQPTSALIKEVPASLMENRMAAQGFDRAAFNFKQWVKTAMPDGNVRKLIKTPGREGQYMQKASQWMNLMGDKATASASKGWAETYERLLKFDGDDFVEDRTDDFFSIMKLQTTEGKEAARKSLEDYAAAIANAPDAKVWFKDVENLYQKAYRYDSFEPGGGWSNFDGRFPARPEGWYASFDLFDNKFIATDRLLLPLETSAPKYRFEFDVPDIKDNIRMARGKQDTDAAFELLTRDEPLNFVGGGTSIKGNATHVILENSNTVKRVVDMDTGNQVWPIP